MDEATRSPTPAEAQERLAKAQSISVTSINAAAWPVAMVFTSLAILGFMLMVGMHIVSHTGYGAPILAGVSLFRDRTLWYYASAAVVLACVGLTGAFRELRA
jgi:hypothetical protein